MVFDNSGVNPDLVFVKSTDQSIRVINKIKFTLIKIITMKTHDISPKQKKILEGLDKVYEKLMEFKR